MENSNDNSSNIVKNYILTNCEIADRYNNILKDIKVLMEVKKNNIKDKNENLNKISDRLRTNTISQSTVKTIIENNVENNENIENKVTGQKSNKNVQNLEVTNNGNKLSKDMMMRVMLRQKT